ncbi:hypothetical protein ABUE31_04730 [Mesorhizobium sp. ZMM04-5]|uniref:Uncharacterized protein n=1 Tax=Mesorhizobium marinum TaxID=3228790 RepID=A0ABV3QW47_9HYPH
MNEKSYSQVMGEQSGILTLKLDTAEPIELGDFVGAFTSIANEFERYVADTYPGAKADPRIYLREVRSGCVEADMITGLTIAAGVVINNMDQILILEEFVRRWGRRMTALITNKVPDGELDTTAQLNDYYRATESIAADPLASHRLTATAFEKDGPQIRVAFQFSAVEARTAQQNIDDRKKLLTKPDSVPHRRVLMRYTRTDVHDATVNKRSGERVLIAEISEKEMPVMYASELAEQEIREIIREADENAYKRGFVVDVMVQASGEKMTHYAVTAFHSVIDLD